MSSINLSEQALEDFLSIVPGTFSRYNNVVLPALSCQNYLVNRIDHYFYQHTSPNIKIRISFFVHRSPESIRETEPPILSVMKAKDRIILLIFHP